MTVLDMSDIDRLDEEYLGPPPRFLVENSPRDFSNTEPDFTVPGDGEGSALGMLKSIFGLR
jgi:hypothetical protein